MTTKDDINLKLDQIPKGNPFKTPDNYFDNFSVRMADKISQTEAAKVYKPMFAWGKTQLTMAIAFAGVAIMVVVGIKFLQNYDKPLSSQELADALEYSIVSEMDENDIINQMDAVNQKMSLSNDSVAKIQENGSKQLIDYLSAEDLDENAIIDAL